MTNKLPLYRKLYEQQKYHYNLIHNFRKEYKYTLGKDILQLSWNTLDNIIRANSLPNERKKQTILEASICFDKVKTRLRIAHELKLISHQRYTFIIEQNSEISKMLSGWLKWAKTYKEK